MRDRDRDYLNEMAVAANQNVKERDYWLNQLSGDFVKSCFPYDFKKGVYVGREIQTLTSRDEKTDGIIKPVRDELFEKLMTLSSGIDIKLHMILVAGLAALLYKYSGSKDISIGSPITKQDIEGSFINTILVFRNQLHDIMNFKELILQVRETIIQAVENQNYPLELLPGLLKLPVLENEFPLFDIALLLENIHDKSYLEGIDYNMLFSFHRLENRIEFSLEYNSLLYRERTVKQIIVHYTHLLEKALSDVNIPLAQIDILSEAEKQRLLKEFNANAVDFPKNKTFHQLFEEQVEKVGHQIALVGSSYRVGTRFIASGTRTLYVHITYRELNEQSDHLAWVLQEKGVQPDNVVGLMVNRSIEMIIGILGILKSGGAYLPIDPDYPEERIRYMLADSSAKILLTSRDNIPVGTGGLAPLYLPIDDRPKTYPEKQPAMSLDEQPSTRNELSQPATSSENIAYIIYTSGSTGKPKGVMVQHNHFVNVALGWRKEYKLQEMEVILLQMASFSFDVFAGDLARTFLNGGKMVINPEQAAAPESLYQLIEAHRVTLLESTPSYIIPFMDYVYENHLPIDSLQLLILGSDTCPVRDFKKLLTRFGKQMRIINSYGVTEATIDSSYYEEGIVERIPPVSSIPIGKPLPNVKFYILNSAGTLMPPGVPGELHIGGESVTRGYLNNPELTAEKFDQNFFDDQDYQDNKGPATREPFKKKEKGTAKLKHMSYMSYLPYLKLYHTGDLARWLPDGNIEFLGRMDNQIKVRGFRIELGEIENKLLEHADIKQAAVLERITENDDKYLCGYVISDKNLEPADLRDFLGKKLPDYMVPWFFVQMEQFPLTPTGKIDRKALPEPETSGEVKYVAPRDKTEEKLVELWSKVLGKEKEEIGIDTNFFDLGGNSIKAIVLTTKMHKELNVKLLMTDIFILQTIRKISELIKETEEEKFIPIEPTEKKEYYRLSPAQKRLYILQQMKLNSTAYNMPLTVTVDVKIQEGLKKERLETIFCQLIERHESVRTSFEMIKREPVQRIHNKVEFRIEFYDMTRTQVEAGMPHSPQDIIKNFLKPFDLSHAPLLRVGLMKTGNEGHLLMVDMHHIITDGISHQILINDFLALDEGEALPSLRIQYKDFSEWQNRDKQKEAVKMQEAYWLKQFERGIPVLNLPTDYPRDEVEGYEGSFIRFEIGVEETNALRQMILAEDTTMFMLLLAVTYVLFLNLGGQEGIGIVMGTVAAGRSHYDLEQVIGMFVNTLALINYPQKEKTFAEFLQEVKKRVLDAFENQDYQFEDLVDKVGVKRNPGRHPLFDVMFTFQTSEPISDTVNKKVSERAILTVEQEQRQLEYENIDRTAKFDLTFNGVDAGEKLFFEVEYSTKLFKKETIQRYARYYKEILFCVLENKETQLKEIKISHDLYEEQLDNPQIVFGF